MPNNVSTLRDVDRHPVIYAGRFVDQVTSLDLLNDSIVLGGKQALPDELAKVLNCASTIVFLDLLSFPFEAMVDDHWKVPIVVVLPSSFDVESLITTFGSVLFERLEFFDHIVTSDSALWEKLRGKYAWAESQRIPVVDNDPSEFATAVRAAFEAEPTSSPTSGREEHSDHEPSLINSKALHLAQAAVLKPQFTAPTRGERDAEVALDVLQVGAGAGSWVTSFNLKKTRFVGIDAREDLVRVARANFPDQRFDHLGSDLRFPCDDESFDVVFSVNVMHDNPTPAKRTLLSEMWRVARPGGRLLFLETFVFTKESKKPDTHPISVTEFEDLILDTTAGQAVLEHVESLRYPGEDLRRGGLISVLKLGVPKT